MPRKKKKQASPLLLEIVHGLAEGAGKEFTKLLLGKPRFTVDTKKLKTGALVHIDDSIFVRKTKNNELEVFDLILRIKLPEVEK